jgi:hypothetical protein
VPDATDTPADRDWRHPWLRINLVLREIKHQVFRVRHADARPVLKAELNKAIAMRAKMKRHIWWN